MAEKKQTFEQSMKRLEQIISELERNDRSLDETISLFEEGLGLVHDCDATLKEFENRIDEIMKKNGGSDENV